MTENLLLEGWEDEEYKAFVDKFKTKKTTDDCYTPPEIYDVIADWVAGTYHRDKGGFLRPFYPGGDYERFEYPPPVDSSGQPALQHPEPDRAVLRAAQDPVFPLRPDADPVLRCGE
jgi:hypothetical protein